MVKPVDPFEGGRLVHRALAGSFDFEADARRIDAKLLSFSLSLGLNA